MLLSNTECECEVLETIWPKKLVGVEETGKRGDWWACWHVRGCRRKLCGSVEVKPKNTWAGRCMLECGGRAGVWACGYPTTPGMVLKDQGEGRSRGVGKGRVQMGGEKERGAGWGSGRDGEAGWGIKGSPADRPT